MEIGIGKRLANVHPGEVLNEEFLKPLNITPYRLAQSIGVQQTRVGQILAGARGITADTAIRLGRYFNTTPQFWLNLQAMYDLEEETRREKHQAAYARIQAYDGSDAALADPLSLDAMRREISIGSDQSDRGEYAVLDAEEIKAAGRRLLAERQAQQ